MQFMRNILDKIEPHFSKDGKFSKYYPIYEAADTFLFSPSIKTQSGPHIRDAIDIKRVMFFVIIAMMPALFFGIYNVGYQKDGTGTIIDTFFLGLPIVLPIIIFSYVVGGRGYGWL